MSEQLKLGETHQAVASFDYRREYIDVCIEEDGEFVFSAGAVATRGSDEQYKKDKAALSGRLNGVLEHFGIDSQNWTENIIELRTNNYRADDRSTSGRRIHARGEERSAGEFIHDAAFWAMPMEGELDGEGEATLVVKLSANHVLEVTGKGHYGRERYYRDPECGDKPKMPFMSDVRFEAIDDEDDPLYLGFEDWHRISFKGRIVSAAEVEAASS